MAHAMLARTDSLALDRFTQLAARVLEVPVVCVSMVDADRRLVTISHGLCVPITLLVFWSFMKQIVASGRPLLVTYRRTDTLLGSAPADPDATVTAYAGVRVVTSDGRPVGTLAVMDEKPRRWSARQLRFLRELSVRIAHEVEGAA
jgi:GAF domain-containing protein